MTTYLGSTASYHRLKNMLNTNRRLNRLMNHRTNRHHKHITTNITKFLNGTTTFNQFCDWLYTNAPTIHQQHPSTTAQDADATTSNKATTYGHHAAPIAAYHLTTDTASAT